MMLNRPRKLVGTHIHDQWVSSLVPQRFASHHTGGVLSYMEGVMVCIPNGVIFSFGEEDGFVVWYMLHTQYSV